MWSASQQSWQYVPCQLYRPAVGSQSVQYLLWTYQMESADGS